MIRFLSDIPSTDHYPLPEGAELIISPQSRRKPLTWIRGAWLALCKVKSGDTLVCFLDIQGLVVYVLSFLMPHKRFNLVLINILLKKKPTLKNRLTAWLYRRALSSKRVRATVTSQAYGDWLKSEHGICCDFTLLHDLYDYDDLKSYCRPESERPGVFCGGRNGRDWPLVMRVAASMPDVAFKLVMSRGDYIRCCEQGIADADNIEIYTDICFDEFMQVMASSAVAVMPVDTQAPAGLIVMFQSAAVGVPVVANDTVVTREYLGDGRGVLLPDGVGTDVWTETLYRLLNDPNSRKEMSDRFYEFLITECGPDAYVKSVLEVIASFK